VTKTFSTSAEVNTFNDSGDVTVVYFGDDSNHLEAFTSFARSNDDIQFGICSSEDCLSHFKVTKGTVVLFKKFDEKKK